MGASIESKNVSTMAANKTQLLLDGLIARSFVNSAINRSLVCLLSGSQSAAGANNNASAKNAASTSGCATFCEPQYK